MDFNEIALARGSCRNYDTGRHIEREKLDLILEAARLAPSACNGQPYHITVCSGEILEKLKDFVGGKGSENFARQAPVHLVISEEPYLPRAERAARMKGNDYRSMDIGIVAAYITAEATALGLGTCMIGWFEDEPIRALLGLEYPVRLVITLGYPSADYKPKPKERKSIDELSDKRE